MAAVPSPQCRQLARVGTATVAEMAADPAEARVTAEEKIIAEASEAAEAAKEEITAEAT